MHAIDLMVGNSMPRIKVKYFAGLRELLGNTKEEEYKAKDRTMLMDLLLKHIPERHRNISGSWKEMIFETEKDGIKFDMDGTPVLSYYQVLINGWSYRWVLQDGRRPGLRYELKEGDVIAIFPPVGGG